jgi:hypothetical protein
MKNAAVKVPRDSFIRDVPLSRDAAGRPAYRTGVISDGRDVVNVVSTSVNK